MKKIYNIQCKTDPSYQYIIKMHGKNKYKCLIYIRSVGENKHIKINKTTPLLDIKDILPLYNIIKEYNNINEVLIDFPELILL